MHRKWRNLAMSETGVCEANPCTHAMPLWKLRQVDNHPYIGGSRECIEAILSHPDLEALPTTLDASTYLISDTVPNHLSSLHDLTGSGLVVA